MELFGILTDFDILTLYSAANVSRIAPDNPAPTTRNLLHRFMIGTPIVNDNSNLSPTQEGIRFGILL